ncbi:protein of unknown function [Taphrina deformans PYCC 5710]|uniref:Uncharacterized protein n=1 Tax=Taphrina deformans (strain PYCC 5710 / ATCC 11124 / CBS 356.35 / IMI 108563 / JCM 9778 / NBRC 8474) TaxID=1097556 RepID=R4X9W6_TAPDE|nr:protein of unknown function [Taphrina deformans PYCC 5710]|eukprot:CCG82593.1 protein of unknown function [Taphrina deformans PYCC 5710]
MSPYSAYLSPVLELLQLALTTKVPGTSVPVIFVAHALRLSLAYQQQTRKTTSWLQGMFSVCALPMAGGLVSTMLTGSLPPFLQSDVVIPTYMVTYLVIHNSGFIRGLLNTMPPQVLEFMTMPADAILKGNNICGVGVDRITSHSSATVKHNWFAPILVGGSVGSAGFLSLTSLNLFSPVWTLNSRIDAVEWDLFGPYVLSFLYLACRGTNPQINNVVWSLSQGVIGGRKASYFTKDEARALIVLTQMGVSTLKSAGIWNGRFPGGFTGPVAPSRLTESKKLGSASKKDL